MGLVLERFRRAQIAPLYMLPQTGSKRTFDLAQKRGKPVLHIAKDGGTVAAPKEQLRRFIKDNGIKGSAA